MATRDGAPSFSVRAQRAWKRIVFIPFCFMGMGIFRVWTETLYANGQMGFPALGFTLDVPFVPIDGYSLFDLVAACALIVFALLARRIAPLYRHPAAIVLTAVCMVGSACVNFASLLAPEAAPMLFVPSVTLGGVGIALILMLWSEFFGCINPLRVALYYSASIAVSCLVLWVFKGLSFWWLWAGCCLVPVVSLLCLWRAYATLPPDAYPPAYQADFSFPWKPVAAIGTYSFAYGLRGGIFSGPLAMNSGIGAFLGALAVYVLVCRSINQAKDGSSPSAAEKREGQPAAGADSGPASIAFDFSLLYKIAMPVMFAALLPLDAVVPAWRFLADTCALFSYTMLLVLIMAILSNLSYQYGVCALWIFSIERAVRLLASQSGRIVGHVVQEGEFGPVAQPCTVLVVAALLVVVALIFFSEKSISSSQWGVVLKQPVGEDAGLQRNRLGVKCHKLGQQAGLTPREEEILLLVAQQRTLGEMARELYIGTNTVKTHTKHVYQKLGVHSRAEVLELLGVRE